MARAAGARLASCCQAIGISKRTIERWRREAGDRRQKPRAAPANKLSESESSTLIDALLEPAIVDLAPRAAVAALADQGRYVGSASTMYRHLKKAHIPSRRRVREPGPAACKPRALKAEAPGQVWVWDVTWMRSQIDGQWYYMYAFEDLYSRKIVACEVHERQTPEIASAIIERACRAQGRPAALHADNGSAQRGLAMHAKLEKLGIAASHSRPGVSDDNPHIESLFKTLKTEPLYPKKGFESLEQARKWAQSFVDYYNEQRLHGAIGYVTPAQRHSGQADSILEKRRELFERVKKENPARWSQPSKDIWLVDKTVWLNPDKDDQRDFLARQLP